MQTNQTISVVSNDALRRLFIAVLILVSASLIGNRAVSAQDLKEGQGIVIGTIVVNVAEPNPNSSFLRGARKLGKIKWALTIEKSEGFTLSNHYIKVESGSEKHFLVKLNGGSYRFDQLVAQGFANFYFPARIQFEVTPQTTTYIGRLEITIPYRMNEGPGVWNVADSQEETVEALKDDSDNAKFVVDVSKSLMRIEE